MKLISEIDIVPIKPIRGLIGFASFVLYESVYCGSVGIYTRPEGGYRLTFPKRSISGKSLDIYYPITKELGKAIQDEVIKKYEDVVRLENDRYCCYNAGSV